MIRVTQIDDDHFDIEIIGKGIPPDVRRIHRSRLPKAISASLASLNVSGIGKPIPRIGIKIDCNTWELLDASLQLLSGLQEENPED